MSLPTVAPEVPLPRLRRARALRRTFLALLAVFVGAGAVGMFGVRTGVVEASGGGYELKLEYPRVARPGLAVPWSLKIHRDGGFDGPITVAATDSYFDLFDENAMEPEPASCTTDGERVIWELETPEEGDTMTLSLDTRLGPNIQWGRKGEAAVLEQGRPVVSVRFRTWVMP